MRMYASQLFREENIEKMPTRRAILATVVVLAFGLIAAAASAQAIIYVDDNVPLGGDGATWNTAFRYLQDGLQLAAAGDDIRVAGGMYTPDQDEGGNVTSGDRTATFQLLTGVALRGGYAGLAKPDNPDLRDIDFYETILSGDLSGNDGPGFAGNDENSYHVVTGGGTDETAVMDGVTVTGGNADGPANSDQRDGGGLFNVSGSPTLTHCMFTANSAKLGGGGMFNESFSTPTLANCTFTGNVAGQGGGMWHRANPTTLTNCLFSRNRAIGTGKFGSGGGIHYSANLTITNCVFFENSADTQGGALWTSSTPVLTNCIVWGNSPSQEQIYLSFDSPSLVSYSCVEGGFPGIANIAVDPLLTADGKHLQAGSPCIDTGDPSGDYAGLLDLDEEPRVVGLGPDMGVDEWLDTDLDGLPDWWELLFFGSTVAGDGQGDEDSDGNLNLDEYARNSSPFEPAVTIFVDNAGDDAWDGLAAEWDGSHGPKATIQAAIDIADPFERDEIVIADGVFTGPGNIDLDTAGKRIRLRSANGPENCVIDGGGAGRGFHFHSFETPQTVLEGLTIRNGSASQGGSVYCDRSSPTLTNCVFSENIADGSGGGIYNFNSSSTLTNCVFSENFAGGNGGGIYNSNSSPALANCVFSGNVANNGGGMFNVFDSNPALTNCTFTVNAAGDRAGGMYNLFDSSPTLTDCVFSGNLAYGLGGGGMYNELDGSPVLKGCTFTVNSADNGGGMYNRDESNPALTNCMFTANSADDGGGMYNDSSRPALANCTFLENRANNDGGGMYNDPFGRPVLTSCRFSGNSAHNGGGMYNFATRPTLTNCTISGNRADNEGGGIYNYSANPVLTSCIVSDNSPSQIFDEIAQIADVSYSCVEGDYLGTGNIDTDPQFIEQGYWDDNGTPDDPADDIWVDGNYRLMANSPCIDAGDPGFVTAPGETDLDGHPRVLCGRVDMGAYEFGIGDFDCSRQVNLFDFNAWPSCMTGPTGGPYPEGCEAFDFDADGLITLRDFAGFQSTIDGG